MAFGVSLEAGQGTAFLPNPAVAGNPDALDALFVMLGPQAKVIEVLMDGECNTSWTVLWQNSNGTLEWKRIDECLKAAGSLRSVT